MKFKGILILMMIVVIPVHASKTGRIVAGTIKVTLDYVKPYPLRNNRGTIATLLRPGGEYTIPVIIRNTAKKGANAYTNVVVGVFPRRVSRWARFFSCSGRQTKRVNFVGKTVWYRHQGFPIILKPGKHAIRHLCFRWTSSQERYINTSVNLFQFQVSVIAYEMVKVKGSTAISLLPSGAPRSQ